MQVARALARDRFKCASIDAAVREVKAGRMIVVVDGDNRENQGDLMMAAEMITSEAVNFMAIQGRGLICLAMTGERLDPLQRAPMAPDIRVFPPLRARAGGVLERRGLTEAAVDLARLAGLYPAGVICQIVKDDGARARVRDLVRFCRKHGLLMITVADLVQHRLESVYGTDVEMISDVPANMGSAPPISFRVQRTGTRGAIAVRVQRTGTGRGIAA